jgi:hypothetical protein
VEWESRVWKWENGRDDNCLKADRSGKNPHNFPARRFALKAEEKDKAIYCWSDYGPHFSDIGVSDNCNANSDSRTRFFGKTYNNDTGLDGETFFTGSRYFQVKEIEVFEIAE